MARSTAAASFAVLNLLVLLFLLPPPACAHYNLKDPAPYNPIDCNPPDCRGPCPPIWKSGASKARYSPQNPFTTWRRGQRVRVEWHRNNHEGGFYRRSLVPVKHMNSHYWHRRLAFEWGCFAQGRYRCGFRPSCGTDVKGRAYRNHMTVPPVFPDGDYVFAMVWYGGLHWRRRKAYFSDYWTCSFVRIRGGQPVAKRYTPTFVPGRNHRKRVPPGKCVSTSQWVGQCGGEPCHSKPVKTTIPGDFWWGKTPPDVLSKDLGFVGKGTVTSMGGRKEERSLERKEEKRNAKEAKHDRILGKQALREEQRLRRQRAEKKRRQQLWWQQQQRKKKRRQQLWWQQQQRKKKRRQQLWWQQQQRKKKHRPQWKKHAQQPKKKKYSQQPKKKRHSPQPKKKKHSQQPKKKRHNPYANEPRRWRTLPKWRRRQLRRECSRPVPPAPTGAWGPRYSGMWNWKRFQWWRNHNFCKKCPHRC